MADASVSGAPSGAGEAQSALASPVELVGHARGSFYVGEEAVRVLEGLKGPVGVVAVCGRARQGKSYILNQLLGKSGAFKVASTHKPCTKGIWLWSDPVRMVSKEGEEYHLVSEGSGT